jgi:hypothetical protein
MQTFSISLTDEQAQEVRDGAIKSNKTAHKRRSP